MAGALDHVKKVSDPKEEECGSEATKKVSLLKTGDDFDGGEKGCSQRKWQTPLETRRKPWAPRKSRVDPEESTSGLRRRVLFP